MWRRGKNIIWGDFKPLFGDCSEDRKWGKDTREMVQPASINGIPAQGTCTLTFSYQVNVMVYF